VTRSLRLAAPVPALLAAGLALLFTLGGGTGEASPAQARGPLGSGKPVTLAFGGDVHFEGVLAGKLAASPATLLDPIEPVLESSDLAVVNLETAVTNAGLAASKEYVFRAPATAFAALRGGGVDVASLANNHGMDYGVQGLRDSMAAARKYRFPVIGAGMDAKRAYAPYRVTIRGQRIAVIGATQVLDDHLISAWTAGHGKPGLASAKQVARLVQEVERARDSSDTVVVFLHWGVEGEGCPSSRQKSLASALTLAGADVIVGGHAHRQQGAGRMQGALVAYGLGNFVWYGTTDTSTRTGVLKVTATGQRIDSYEWVPARISGGVPRAVSGTARKREVAAWKKLRGCAGLRP
jgi:poly-gamma-glutamate capsule biosynthesis protein CapA/YwtB (metallophosphatase superfamily)